MQMLRRKQTHQTTLIKVAPYHHRKFRIILELTCLCKYVAITKYEDHTKRVSGMMENYLRQLEKKIQESPLKPLTAEISYTFTGNTINWTLIDKTVLEFQTVMNRLHMKFPIVKEMYDYSRLIEAFDDESPSPPLESEVARDIYSELKCCRDQKFLLYHDLQQLENKVKNATLTSYSAFSVTNSNSPTSLVET